MESLISQRYILVAGGAGFIGSHLCERLVEEGHRVICLDNLYTGSENNISHLRNYPSFEFVRHDVTEPYSHKDISMIFNLACPASPVHYQKNPVYTTRTAVIGTFNMLELARANQCPLIQASTSEVYGDPEVHPQPETYYGNVNPVGVRSCYDEGKRCAESLCMDYHRQYGVPVKIVRIFNTYGPRMTIEDGRVIPNFISQALKGKNITIYGDGTQTRSFMYVDDLIEGLMRLMNTNDGFTGPVNLGNPEEISMIELAYIVVRLTDSCSQIIHHPLPSDDPKRRCPDISLAFSILNCWKACVPVSEGIRRTVDYFVHYGNICKKL